MSSEQSDGRWVVIEEAKADICRRIGLDPRDVFRAAQETFEANLRKHLDRAEDATQAARAALADLYLAGVLQGRDSALAEIHGGSRS